MTLSVFLIASAGYLSFRSMSSIVSSIRVKSKPDLRLYTIREITSDLEKAENSVRLFTLTRKEKDIQPYYSTISGVDDKINRLRSGSSMDTLLLFQLDTITGLIEENIVIWDRMLELYQGDSLDNYIKQLSDRLSAGLDDQKNRDKSILKRVFSRRDENIRRQEEIIQGLNILEQQDSIKNRLLQTRESQLAATGSEISERFYNLIAKMEDEVISSIEKNALAADNLAVKTYLWLAVFTALTTLLVILVLVIVVRFVRKTHQYQKALERSMEEKDKLTRTRELFMANMSHEIRTPVNAIFGFTEQLLYNSFDEKSRKILSIIKSSSDHLVNIINDILDFSRLQHAKIILEKSHFQIFALCEEVQLLFEKKAGENNTRLSHTIDKSTPAVLLGDHYRLKQIMINLVGNAVKFTRAGEVHFTVNAVKRSGRLNLLLEVTDTGIGISENMLDSIFDDFTQAETNTTRKYGGTGLGLSIVKKLVELHRGTITVKSKKNQGTTFTCLLPYNAGEWEKLPPPAQSVNIPEEIKRMKLLIVDDEEYNRLLFKTILDRWQVKHDEAEDGSGAIEMIRKGLYDIIFMDVRMPGTGGLNATATIRNELKFSETDLPVIGISATHTEEDLLQFRSSGMNAFLPKPFTENQLLHTILSVTGPGWGNSGRINVLPVAEIKTTLSKDRINLENLYHLADNDISFVKQMLNRFIESTEQGLDELKTAVGSADYDTAGETAHKIASPCKHLGADKLYSYLKNIEDLARNGVNQDSMVKLAEDSLQEFAVIRSMLNDHIANI